MKKLLTGLVALALLTACGTTAPEQQDTAKTSQSADAAQFPRTVSVGGTDVEVPAKPQRIAVLTPDLASLVLPLVGKDRVVMASEMNPELGKVAEEAAAVPHVVKVGAPVDPEQVLASNPDLVLISARHDGEKDATAMLKQSGVPLAVVSSDDWSSIDDILTHLDEVAKLVGEEDAGKELRSSIETERAKVLKKVEGEPTVLTMMSRGGKNLIMSKTTMLNGLVREVGGKPVIDELGAPGSAPADPETIVKAAPEVIIIQNYRGRGAEDFKAVLENPALADVPAIKNGRVYYVDTATTGVTSVAKITEGLAQVSEFLTTK